MEKRRILNTILSAFILLSSALVEAQVTECTDNLKQFPIECQLQLDWHFLKEKFAQNYKIDINDIAEYKALRFIDRWSWQGAKVKSPQKKISDIYKPKGTWEQWNQGIDNLMKKYKNLPHFLNSDSQFIEMITEMNHQLLLDPRDRHSARDYSSTQVGFCDILNEERVYKLESSRESFEIYQKIWETNFQINLVQLMKKEKALKPLLAEMGGEVYQRNELGHSCQAKNDQGYRQMWIEFTLSYKVRQQLSWLRVFLKWNLQNILSQHPNAISPIELSSVVQKWFVSIHPFHDGNGRTSRAVQDLIHQFFGLPFVPSGDLQDDIYTNVDTYIEQNKNHTLKILQKLQGCYRQTESQVWKNEYEKYACQVLKNGVMP